MPRSIIRCPTLRYEALAMVIEDGELIAGGESVAGGLVTAGLPQALTRKAPATRIAISSRTARPRLRRFFT